MPRGLAFFIAAQALLAVQSATWQDAVKAHDYGQAAALLHPVVLSEAYTFQSADPAPARQLAAMYAGGLGVPRDAIGACALATLAFPPAQNAANRQYRDHATYDARIQQANQFIDTYCATLTADDLQVAKSSGDYCYAFGMPEDIIALDGQLVRVGRRGIGVLDAAESKVGPLTNCPLAIARVRATRIDPPPGAATGVVPRHIVELFAWSHGYVLRWFAYELTGGRVEIVAMEDITAPAPWPATLVPADLDSRVRLEMDQTGNVRWHVDGLGRNGVLRIPSTLAPRRTVG